MPRSPADPLLLTPGPVSVSMSTKQVMLRDRASGGDEFHADINLARDYMVALVDGKAPTQRSRCRAAPPTPMRRSSPSWCPPGASC